MVEADSSDNAGVRIPGPIIYIVFFLLGLVFEGAVPIPALLPNVVAWLIGWMICVASLFFVVPAMRSFRAVRTSMIPFRPASSLVTHGVYGRTRNPMYLSLLLLYAGLSVFFNLWWPIVLAPALVVVMDRMVIAREEAYLLRRFGEEYRRYRERVRRWL
ncbi:MAG: methyltransferase [Roseiarcus sp.]|jgi:protein-S-isoprenylcysteine O-methyltransferase Ste14